MSFINVFSSFFDMKSIFLNSYFSPIFNVSKNGFINFSNSFSSKSPPATIIKLFKEIVLVINFSISFNWIFETDSIVPADGFSSSLPLKSTDFNWF